MFRFLLTAASIFVLIVSTVLFPQPVLACDDRMPLTLLSLYRTSDAIYVGRYDKSVDGEPTEDTADYTAVPIKKHFSISSALKGESRKLLAIDDTEYRFKNQEVLEESEHEDGDGDVAELKSGDTVLLFVKKNEESGELQLTEIPDGIKKLTPDELSVYEARIRELKGIFSGEKPSYSRIIEWLIRCAENPLTRWDGTFELQQSFQNMDWQEQRAKEAKERAETTAEGDSSTTEGAEPDEYAEETPAEFETGDPNFAKNLSQSHKQALTNILLNRERPKKQETAGDSEEFINSRGMSGDRELIELVQRWGDSRVAENLVEQLRHDSSDVNISSDLMFSIASMLHDDELTSVWQSFANIQWESDEDEVVEAAPAAEPVVAVPLTEITPEPAPEPEPVDADQQQGSVSSDGNEAVSDPAKDQPKKKTYGAMRGELVKKFLTRADRVIAKEKEKDLAKLNR